MILIPFIIFLLKFFLKIKYNNFKFINNIFKII